MIAEVFTWVGLSLGALLLIAALIVRAIAGRWIETDAILVDGAETASVRWMSADGLHLQPLTSAERDDLSESEGLRIFYQQRDPSRMRLDAVGHGERVLRLLGLLLLGIGVLGFVVSMALIFVPEQPA
jgi:hypothetical protein